MGKWYQNLMSRDLSKCWMLLCHDMGELTAEPDIPQLDVHGREIHFDHLLHDMLEVGMESFVARRSAGQKLEIAMPPDPPLPSIVHVELGSAWHRG